MIRLFIIIICMLFQRTKNIEKKIDIILIFPDGHKKNIV